MKITDNRCLRNLLLVRVPHILLYLPKSTLQRYVLKGSLSASAALQLLKKTGWRGCGGLGAREQGISMPLAAWNQHGRQGIGAAVPRPKAQIDPRSVATAELAAAVQVSGPYYQHHKYSMELARVYA